VVQIPLRLFGGADSLSVNVQRADLLGDSAKTIATERDLSFGPLDALRGERCFMYCHDPIRSIRAIAAKMTPRKDGDFLGTSNPYSNKPQRSRTPAGVSSQECLP